jgi:predicted amidophosphoribosyltransferase
MAKVRRVMDRTCIVCGHNLGPYGRICDKCGSIQRPAAGSGALLPPDKFKPCEKCGNPVPEESQETLCDECIETERPRPVLVFDDDDKYRKAKTYSLSGGMVSLAALVGCGIALAFISGAWLIVLVALGGIGLGVSGAVFIIVSKRSGDQIEYYAPIKPEDRT